MKKDHRTEISSNTLSHQRCFNHGHREAVARCPECRRPFCRECVTEHEDRVLCTSCLKRLVKPPLLKRLRLAPVTRILQSLLGFLIVWMVFYYLGQALLLFPTSFHEGTVWYSGWSERE